MAERTHAPSPVSLRQPADRLLARSLSAFHTIGLMVLLLAFVHHDDALGAALSSLGTGAGITLYLALWATTSWTTARALRFFPLAEAEAQSWFAFPKLGFILGSTNGIAFLWALAVVVAFKTVTGTDDITMQALLPLGFYLAFTSIVAGIVGAVIGLVFGFVDRCLLGIGLTLARKMAALAEE